MSFNVFCPFSLIHLSLFLLLWICFIILGFVSLSATLGICIACFFVFWSEIVACILTNTRTSEHFNLIEAHFVLHALKIFSSVPVAVVQTCNLIYLGSRNQEDCCLRPAWAKSSWDSITTNKSTHLSSQLARKHK
jgi:hypothetical protein